MILVANLLIVGIALLHVWILILELFLWTTPLGLKAFRQSAEAARQTALLAKNQGVYNGFLAAGLFWGFATGDHAFKVFFLGCVIVAGLVGGSTVNKRIFFVQALPALIALGLFILG